MKNEVQSEAIKGMEAYKKGLLLWLDAQCRKDITRGAKKMSDVYIGRLNAYSEIIEHIKGNLRKKKKPL